MLLQSSPDGWVRHLWDEAVGNSTVETVSGNVESIYQFWRSGFRNDILSNESSEPSGFTCN